MRREPIEKIERWASAVRAQVDAETARVSGEVVIAGLSESLMTATSDSERILPIVRPPLPLDRPVRRQQPRRPRRVSRELGDGRYFLMRESFQAASDGAISSVVSLTLVPDAEYIPTAISTDDEARADIAEGAQVGLTGEEIVQLLCASHDPVVASSARAFDAIRPHFDRKGYYSSPQELADSASWNSF